MGIHLVVVVDGPRERNRNRSRLERRTAVGESPVDDTMSARRVDHPSTAGHEKPCGNPGGPPPKATYIGSPIVHEYREGTVKSTPGGE